MGFILYALIAIAIIVGTPIAVGAFSKRKLETHETIFVFLGGAAWPVVLFFALVAIVTVLFVYGLRGGLNKLTSIGELISLWRNRTRA